MESLCLREIYSTQLKEFDDFLKHILNFNVEKKKNQTNRTIYKEKQQMNNVYNET